MQRRVATSWENKYAKRDIKTGDWEGSDEAPTVAELEADSAALRDANAALRDANMAGEQAFGQYRLAIQASICFDAQKPLPPPRPSELKRAAAWHASAAYVAYKASVAYVTWEAAKSDLVSNKRELEVQHREAEAEKEVAVVAAAKAEAAARAQADIRWTARRTARRWRQYGHVAALRNRLYEVWKGAW